MAHSLTQSDLREFQKTLRNSDKPLKTTDPFYVAHMHGQNGQDVVLRLAQEIEDTEGTGLYYFTGQRGTGKSTELLRLKSTLEKQGCRCVLFNSLDFLNDTQPIDAEILMLMVAAAVAEWLSREYQIDPTAQGLLTRFTEWMKTEVELEKINVGGGLSFSLKPQQASVTKKIKTIGSQQRFQQELLQFIVEMTQIIAANGKFKVVLIVDSLEQLRGNTLASEQDQMFASVARVFADQMDLIKVTGAHTVYSVPPYLCLLENVKAQVPWYSLASVGVYEKPEHQKHTTRLDGLRVMRQLLDKRWTKWRDVLSEAALDRLSALSGGDLRQFIVRLLVDVIYQAQFALDSLPLQKDDPILKNVEDACTTEMLQLTVREEWPLLEQVMQSNNIVVQKREELKTLAHLLDTKVILNYRNGKDWYDIHPSLWSPISPAAQT